jgi:hypothetical protein
VAPSEQRLSFLPHGGLRRCRDQDEAANARRIALPDGFILASFGKMVLRPVTAAAKACSKEYVPPTI